MHDFSWIVEIIIMTFMSTNHVKIQEHHMFHGHYENLRRWTDQQQRNQQVANNPDLYQTQRPLMKPYGIMGHVQVNNVSEDGLLPDRAKPLGPNADSLSTGVFRAKFSETWINKANLRDLTAATGPVIWPKSDPNHQFFSLCDQILWMI